ncbi:unnamed protein product [Didymodactylos carnosus]|uniref:G-protein coupled receptors family 1 profile domain-containing protein n=1 Tax=Didymodactylos carnosus TaxID=1234261 RepID=A0A814X8T8_9BILA|nr:unnamed protein product [Didymodactylos carnosus]CAF1216039.1 unnamed protein product [Didymodactylos carnosus]CAF3793803.1 unnamed protein product [Didymodactylos carnosus]CAF3979835.1 unnamed protein product [Didymodactylos carnosus]
MTNVSTTTLSPLISQLNSINSDFNRYIPIPLLVLGTLGNIFNLIMFRQKALRVLSCSIYFLSSTVCNFFALYSGLITPFLSLYGLDPTVYSAALCKIRYYIRYTSITLSSWFTLLACIDRFMSTSQNANVRHYSRLPIAYRVTLITVLVGMTGPFTQTFYCYDLINKSCTTRDTPCKLLNDIMLLSCLSFVPQITMVVFTFLTIRNVRKMRMSTRRYDVKLVKMLQVQVIVMVIFYSIPVTAQKLYADSTVYVTGNSVYKIYFIENGDKREEICLMTIKYIELCLELLLKYRSSNDFITGNIFQALAQLYKLIPRYDDALNNYDEALEIYLQQAASCHHGIEMSITEPLKYQVIKHEYKLKLLAIEPTMNDEGEINLKKKQIADSHIELADIYIKLQQHDLAFEHLTIAINFYKETKNSNYEAIEEKMKIVQTFLQ